MGRRTYAIPRGKHIDQTRGDLETQSPEDLLTKSPLPSGSYRPCQNSLHSFGGGTYVIQPPEQHPLDRDLLSETITKSSALV